MIVFLLIFAELISAVNICSLDFSCPAFCNSSKGAAKVARNRAAKCKKAAEEEFERCSRQCHFYGCMEECQDELRRELETCPCWQNEESKSGCTERTVLDLEQYRIMVDDLEEHSNGLESENEHLKAEIEDLNRKSENLSESLADLKIENERLSSEEKRLNTRNYNLWKKLQGQAQKDEEISKLKIENADLIAANMELRRSNTDQEQAALVEIKEDLEKTKREKGEIQEKLDIEKIRNADLESEIDKCKSKEENLKDEIKEERARCLKATQDLRNDLEREDSEIEMLEGKLSNFETEIEELKLESENCKEEEKNSLMVLSGYISKTEFLSYVLKPDGSESPRTIKMPSSNHEYHYLYWSISALIRGKVYIFGGDEEYEFRIAIINDCEIVGLDVKLNNEYYWRSATVTAADQQSALICFPDDEFKNCEEFDGSAVSIKPATKYSHRSSCLALYHDQPVAVNSYLSDGSKKVEKFDGASWTELPDFPKATSGHSCIGVSDGFLLLGDFYSENDEYHRSEDVYLLRDSKWTVVGQLNEYHNLSSAAQIGKTIYLVSGNKKPYAVEKLEWDGEKISSAKVINNHSSYFYRPIIFPVDEFYCT